jgi:hypothetical protein
VAERDVVIGFLRAIPGGIFNGCISMVVVSREYRGQVVGSAIVRTSMGDDDRVT